MSPIRPVTVPLGTADDSVPGLLLLSQKMRCLLLLAHGAGAGMEHPFLASVAERLAMREVGTLRFQFPYMARGSRRPDRQPLLVATIAAAAIAARQAAPELPLFAGGKSMGGRMSSQAVALGKLEDVAGLVFLGFPLHPAGKPGVERAQHLDATGVPLLFLQGTRDRLCDLELLRPILARIGTRASLHLIEGGDHSFEVPRASGRTRESVHDELADTIAAFCLGAA